MFIIHLYISRCSSVAMCALHQQTHMRLHVANIQLSAHSLIESFNGSLRTHAYTIGSVCLRTLVHFAIFPVELFFSLPVFLLFLGYLCLFNVLTIRPSKHHSMLSNLLASPFAGRHHPPHATVKTHERNIFTKRKLYESMALAHVCCLYLNEGFIVFAIQNVWALCVCVCGHRTDYNHSMDIFRFSFCFLSSPVI